MDELKTALNNLSGALQTLNGKIADPADAVPGEKFALAEFGELNQLWRQVDSRLQNGLTLFLSAITAGLALVAVVVPEDILELHPGTPRLHTFWVISTAVAFGLVMNGIIYLHVILRSQLVKANTMRQMKAVTYHLLSIPAPTDNEMKGAAQTQIGAKTAEQNDLPKKVSWLAQLRLLERQPDKPLMIETEPLELPKPLLAGVVGWTALAIAYFASTGLWLLRKMHGPGISEELADSLGMLIGCVFALVAFAYIRRYQSQHGPASNGKEKAGKGLMKRVRSWLNQVISCVKNNTRQAWQQLCPSQGKIVEGGTGGGTTTGTDTGTTTSSGTADHTPAGAGPGAPPGTAV